MSDDPRIPVIVLTDPAALERALAGAPAAVLAETPGLPGGVARDVFAPGAARHVMGCACCQGRSPAAQALDRLFQQRVRGRVAWFDQVVAVLPGAAARAMLETALDEDVLTRARFRRAV